MKAACVPNPIVFKGGSVAAPTLPMACVLGRAGDVAPILLPCLPLRLAREDGSIEVRTDIEAMGYAKLLGQGSERIGDWPVFYVIVGGSWIGGRCAYRPTAGSVSVLASTVPSACSRDRMRAGVRMLQTPWRGSAMILSRPSP